MPHLPQVHTVPICKVLWRGLREDNAPLRRLSSHHLLHPTIMAFGAVVAAVTNQLLFSSKIKPLAAQSRTQQLWVGPEEIGSGIMSPQLRLSQALGAVDVDSWPKVPEGAIYASSYNNISRHYIVRLYLKGITDIQPCPSKDMWSCSLDEGK